MNNYEINGKAVLPEKLYSVGEAAKIVGKTYQTIRKATLRTDSGRLRSGIRRSNGRICIKGMDLLNWEYGQVGQQTKKQ
jgi:hypothetical protein